MRNIISLENPFFNMLRLFYSQQVNCLLASQFETNKKKAHGTEKFVEENEISLLHGHNYQYKQPYLSFSHPY
jgi:hypothetical protein